MALTINKLLIFQCYFIQRNKLYHLKWCFSNKYVRIGQNVFKNQPFEKHFLFLISKWFWIYQYCTRKLFVSSTVLLCYEMFLSSPNGKWVFWIYFNFKLEKFQNWIENSQKKVWHLKTTLHIQKLKTKSVPGPVRHFHHHLKSPLFALF